MTNDFGEHSTSWTEKKKERKNNRNKSCVHVTADLPLDPSTFPFVTHPVLPLQASTRA